MFILDSLLVGGLRFVLDKVALAVDQEANDEGAIRESPTKDRRFRRTGRWLSWSSD